jgi:predicted DNA-binding transcriptional regulator AlpA
MKAFWSWRDISGAKGTSLSTEKREQKTDPAYPRKVKLSEFRVGFPDAEVREYFETLRKRQTELDELTSL